MVKLCCYLIFCELKFNIQLMKVLLHWLDLFIVSWLLKLCFKFLNVFFIFYCLNSGACLHRRIILKVTLLKIHMVSRQTTVSENHSLLSGDVNYGLPVKRKYGRESKHTREGEERMLHHKAHEQQWKYVWLYSMCIGSTSLQTEQLDPLEMTIF